MADTFSLAVIQLKPHPGDPAANRTRTLEWIEQAAAQGARLVVLPELCTTGYLFRDREHLASEAEAVPDDPTLAAWESAARRLELYLAAGLVERAGERLYNTAVLVGPGGLIGRYRKAHLFADEKRLFDPGTEGFPVFDTDLGRIGLLICFDLRFPEAPRALALQGAEILCVPTTWTDLHKPSPWDEHGYCMANYLAKVHAYANRCYVACADRIGREAVLYLGSSMVVDPSGTVIAGPASRDDEEVLIAPVDPSKARDKALGNDNDLFADRRPELYGALSAE